MSEATNIVWHAHHVTKAERVTKLAQKPVVLWFTGLSGSGKSTIANACESLLFAMNRTTYLLDGDNVRHGLNKDLGFDDAARIENIRRIAEVSKLFADAGLIVLTAFISPFQSDRQAVRGLLEAGEFIEVFIDTPLDVCESRDPKGLYKKARRGEIKHFTGIDSAYEAPKNPEIHLQTATMSVEEAAQTIVNYLVKKRYING